MAIHHKNGNMEYAGQTLNNGEYKTVRVMSDDWDTFLTAEVWTGTEVKTVWLYEGGKVEQDATEEVQALANTWEEEQKRKAEKLQKAYRIMNDFDKILKGVRVKVVKGRKIKKGTEGYAFWVGDTKWGMSVGIQIDGTNERQFTSFENVTKILSKEEQLELDWAKNVLKHEDRAVV